MNSWKANNAVQCPICKKVMTRHGIWVHIIGRAKGEAIKPEAKKHLKWLTSKPTKIVTKYTYSFDKFKIIATDYYDWKNKKNKQK